MTKTFYARTGKRILDFVGAFLGLIVLSLPLILVALLIRLSSGGPTLFRQIRVGQFGKPFRIFKFRTMRIESTGRGASLTAAGDPRITPIGRFLRKSKIDELPQLLNVLICDMSLVGPRPEVAEYVAKYTEAQKCVLLAKPGMTGPSADVYEEEVLASHPDPDAFYLATVLPAKLEIDLSYCKSIRLGNDLRLIAATFANILQRMMRVQMHSMRASGVSNLRTQEAHGNPAGSVPLNGEKGSDLSKRESFDLYSRTNQVLLDGCCFAVSLIGAYIIRFESWPSGPNLRQLLVWLPFLVSARLGGHSLRGIYRQVWRFVSFLDAIEIAKSIVIVSGLLVLLRLLLPMNGPFGLWSAVPLSVIVLDGLLSFTSSMGIRGLRRALYSRQRRASTASGSPPKPILLYGAGRAGIMLRKELETNRAYELVGFVDDDPHKVGSTISNTLVLGCGDDLAHLVERYHIREVIISMAMASPLTLARTLAKCRVAKVPAKIIPSLHEILTGQVQISQFRETRAEDVLGREIVEVFEFEQTAGSTYRDKRVLVTGAGGSIGSELVRQLFRLTPSKIVILDKDENSVYELDQELRRKKSSIIVEPRIADVRDADRLRRIYSDFRPQLVFHAAAHKHVPLMERHPCEAVLNNVVGTKNVLEATAEFGAERFVFVSTDKAVNPVNVMGTTKRIGELLVHSFMNSRDVRFASVRFGNLLGSRGSVVPLFSRQIAERGPVTVTDPDVARYFMTIKEAVQLILCAGTLARGGEIFVLDMGNPRRIIDLAREMILLSGLEPGNDIEIAITGLRPGEKLSEELVAPSENLVRTRFAKLSVIEAHPCDTSELMGDISKLVQGAKENDDRRVYELLRSMDLGFSSPVARARAATAGQN